MKSVSCICSCVEVKEVCFPQAACLHSCRQWYEWGRADVSSCAEVCVEVRVGFGGWAAFHFLGLMPGWQSMSLCLFCGRLFWRSPSFIGGSVLPPLGSILPLYPAPLPQLHFLKREWLKGVSVGTFPLSLKKQHKTLVARNEAFIVSTRDNAV